MGSVDWKLTLVGLDGSQGSVSLDLGQTLRAPREALQHVATQLRHLMSRHTARRAKFLLVRKAPPR